MRPVLVTAGATRNPIDAMRYISAHSSGRTGVAIASALVVHGCRVHFLGSPEACLRANAIPSTEEFADTRDLMERMEIWVRANPQGWVIHAAAVGDYELAGSAVGKISSNLETLTLTLRPTPKIADRVRFWSDDITLITFKAAPPLTDGESLVKICRKQLERTRSDLVLGNVLGSLATTTTLVDDSGSEAFDDRAEALHALAARVAHT
ncbi:MAG: hypothetical protein GY913_26120 [Proteobacteria bacterium]|nr:hypothetical protein [Pseudomonadota bacterium]MCP4920393.1 hypothetical protein [Pseudomonadota bacterium]